MDLAMTIQHKISLNNIVKNIESYNRGELHPEEN